MNDETTNGAPTQNTAEDKEEPKLKILCVDDEKNILVSLRRVFRKEGYEIFLAEGGAEGLEILEKEPINLIISDMRMPHMDGAKFLSLAKNIRKNIPSILLTGFADQESTIRAINEGEISAYVSKPWEDTDLKLKVSSLLKLARLEREKEKLILLTHTQNKKLRDWNKKLNEKVEARVSELRQTEGMLDKAYEELSNSYDAVVKLLSHAICAREHMLNREFPDLPIMAQKLAKAAELDDYIAKQIYYSSLLFELGKLALAEKLLVTPIEMLSTDEYNQLMTYPSIGASVLSDIANFKDAARIIENHAEYIDGSGGPKGIKCADIPIGCKVLSIVKDYYLLQSGNYDGIKYTTKDARNFIIERMGKLYDEKLAKLFFDLSIQDDREKEVINEQIVNSRQLQPGMVLSRDCTNGKGLLLLNKGVTLNEVTIKKLIAFEKAYDFPLRAYVLSQ